MKKIPSLFKRDWNGNRALVLPEYTDGTEWVQNGEGVATLKSDGTAMYFDGEKWYHRYDAKNGKNPPQGAIPCQDEPDTETGHWPHWIEVKNTFNQYNQFVESFRDIFLHKESTITEAGTYELVGPGVNSNKENHHRNTLIKHGSRLLIDVPVLYDELHKYLAEHEIEGIVWHHEDGRMCKIKRSDFGLEWPIGFWI